MKKALKIIKTTTLWLIVALAVFMMLFTVISVTTFNRSDRNIFGFRAYIVMSDSMSATDFKAGDLIFSKEVNCATLEEGDVITFISQNKESWGETVTHKIRSRTTDAEGKPGFITYGTTTDTNDETIVTYPYVLGEYKGKVPGMGTFFNFLKTPQGYIVCIFVPFMILIIYQGINCVQLFRRYKKEQTAAMDEERAKIVAEREENAKMLAELQALKAQLEGKSAKPEAAEPETEGDEAVAETDEKSSDEDEPANEESTEESKHDTAEAEETEDSEDEKTDESDEVDEEVEATEETDAETAEASDGSVIFRDLHAGVKTDLDGILSGRIDMNGQPISPEETKEATETAEETVTESENAEESQETPKQEKEDK